MLHHTKAVARGARKALVVADMPFGSYQASVEDGVRNAVRLVKEAGAGAVKLEGAQVPLAEALTRAGIPMMGHVGLTPQSVHEMGGYRVQGRSAEAARRLQDDALALEKAGAFALVIEAVPTDVGADITSALSIPTIGIGAGPGTDGQVLVINDLLGLGDEPPPRFAKAYADLRGEIDRAARAFATDVERGTFPDDDHSYR
jgi:3-methyl-2-oxobutanoate hydroxymethyltransferase